MTAAAAAVRATVDDVSELPENDHIAGTSIDITTNPDPDFHPNPRIAKGMRTTRLMRLRRLLRDLDTELQVFDRDWDELTRKAKRYDELMLKINGFIDNPTQ